MERLAWLLDSSVPVPLTRFRIGLDSLIGLVPGAGDVAGALLSLVVFFQARQLQVPLRTQLRMAGNVLIELVVGAVPVLGDLFDMAFKANQRNVALALEASGKMQRQGRQSRLAKWVRILLPFAVVAVVVGFIALLAALIWRLAGS